MTERPMPAVKALIERNNSYLLIKQKYGEKSTWNLPGGRVEFGEEPREALERELDEEISIEVDIEKPLGMYTFFYDKGSKQVVLTVFRCSNPSDEPTILTSPEDEHILDYGWFSPEEIQDLELGKGVESFLDKMALEQF